MRGSSRYMYYPTFGPERRYNFPQYPLKCASNSYYPGWTGLVEYPEIFRGRPTSPKAAMATKLVVVFTFKTNCHV